MSARTLIEDLERRLASRASLLAVFEGGLDHALIERVYEITPKPAPLTSCPGSRREDAEGTTFSSSRP